MLILVQFFYENYRADAWFQELDFNTEYDWVQTE